MNVERIAASARQAADILPQQELLHARELLHGAAMAASALGEGGGAALNTMDTVVSYAANAAQHASQLVVNAYTGIGQYVSYITGGEVQRADGEESSGECPVTSSPSPGAAGEVSYVRPVPAEWDELLAYTQGLLGNEQPVRYTPEATEAIMGRLSLLDNEMLDQQRYYGFGLIMCGLARALRDPAVRAHAEEAAGRNLYRRWIAQHMLSQEGFGIGDIDADSVSFAFHTLVADANAATSPALQLLNDALHVTAEARQHVIRYPDDRDYSPGEGYTADDGSLRPGVAADFVAEQAAGGATVVVRTVLRKHSVDQMLKQHTPFGQPGPSPQELLHTTSPDDLNFEHIGLRAATMRLDEVGNSLGEYVTVRNGRAVFRNDRVIPTAQLGPQVPNEDDPTMLHARRIRCPALFVDQLIPTMLGSVQAALLHADALVQAHQAHQAHRGGTA